MFIGGASIYYGKSITEVSHDIARTYIEKGDLLIDATLGTGMDTIFLAKTLMSLENQEESASKPQILSFDIQKSSIDIAEQNINNELGLNPKIFIKLIKSCHSKIAEYIGEKEIGLAMFNLGYLPVKDKFDKFSNIYTKPETTIVSIKSILPYLRKHAAIIITAYRSHDNEIEYNAIKEFLCNLDNKYLVNRLEWFNRKNKPPVIFVITKER